MDVMTLKIADLEKLKRAELIELIIAIKGNTKRVMQRLNQFSREMRYVVK